MAQAEGTRYDGFATRLEALLVASAIQHFQALFPIPLTETMRFNLQRSYRNLNQVLVDILLSFEEEDTGWQAVDEYSRFHLLKALFTP
ncbi:MAG TPA: hypothetical protein DD435_09040 [Cyanobacteria bacterium UBA8530]|nr:hypothetical protein [Cyanobacteria bacterium UBA8530]